MPRPITTGSFGAMFLTLTSFYKATEISYSPSHHELEVVASPSQLFTEWPSESAGALEIPVGESPEVTEARLQEMKTVEAKCEWYNASVTFSSDGCSPFSVSRLAVSMAPRALERASRCIRKWETDCILSTEIGLNLPAAFFYEADSFDLVMAIAPRILPPEDQVEGAAEQDAPIPVKVMDVTEQSGAEATLPFLKNVTVEFVKGGSRAPKTTVLTGAPAYCVQLLRRAYDDSCWKSLD